jgi:hypothetical protein
MNPLVEQLQAMTTDIERADWLQLCPFRILIRHEAEIARVLERAGFEAGLKCLEAELALAASVRIKGDGGFRPEPLFAAHVARGEMRVAAKRRDRLTPAAAGMARTADQGDK